MLHTLLMNGVYSGKERPLDHPLFRNMEEQYFILVPLEVLRDAQPGAEGLSFPPGSVVFTEGGIGQSHGDRLVCRILISQLFSVHRSSIIRQRLICGKKLLKWRMKF